MSTVINVNRGHGFTLIEILVVLALIGMLASIILSNLQQAKNEGEDSAIIQTLNNARAEAQFYGQVHNDGSYLGLCNAASEYSLDPYVVAAQNIGSADVNCFATEDDWALEAQLTDSTYYCIADIEVASVYGDSSGLDAGDPECDGNPSD